MGRRNSQGFVLEHRTPIKIGLLLLGTVLIVIGSYYLGTNPTYGAFFLLVGIFSEIGVAYVYREEFLQVESRIERARHDVEDAQSEIQSAQQEIENTIRDIRSIQREVEDLSDDLFDTFGRYRGHRSMEGRIDELEQQVEGLEREFDSLSRGF